MKWLSEPRVLRWARTAFFVVLFASAIMNGLALAVALRADAGQREGRRIATAANCAAISAVIDAGRATISNGAALPPRLQRELERYGYPTVQERKTAAALAAATYAISITAKVKEFTGRTDLVKKDGSLDCAKLRREATAP